MTRFEADAILKQQEQEIADLEATLLVLKLLHEDAKAMLQAQEQINKRLEVSMQVFDPGYEWDNTGKYEN